MSERFAVKVPMPRQGLDPDTLFNLLEDSAQRSGAVRESEWVQEKIEQENGFEVIYFTCLATRT